MSESENILKKNLEKRREEVLFELSVIDEHLRNISLGEEKEFLSKFLGKYFKRGSHYVRIDYIAEDENYRLKSTEIWIYDDKIDSVHFDSIFYAIEYIENPEMYGDLSEKEFKTKLEEAKKLFI